MKYTYPALWTLQTPPENECIALAADCSLSPFLTKLLWNRGLRTASEINAFLKLSEKKIPSSDQLPDLDRAVARLIKAIENKEKVLVFGDYDVDGITSTVLLYSYLESEGARVSYYIPTRSGEGYGLNSDVIERYAKEDITLLVTVDSGVTAFEEVELCKTLGIDVILTDHHRCRKTLPEALAVVNPMREDSKYPFASLAGVGVVFKLLCALESQYKHTAFDEAAEEMSRRYIDLVAIGTVADVMPLIDENRLFVSRGLAAFPHTKNIGLAALLQEIHPSATTPKTIRYNSGTIGFLIAPRINAAGRVGSAMRAVELFLTKDPKKAADLSAELCEENKRRQVAETLIHKEASAAIEQSGSAERDLFLIEDNENWHQGVVGIVASRLCEQYHRPCILFSYPDGPNGPAKGSGRSIKGLNLVEALASCEKLLLKYGGHELAAGVTIEKENLPALREALNQYAKEHLKDCDLVSTRDADFALEESDLTLENASSLAVLEPFGMKNPKPLFLLKNAKVHSIHPVGDGKHSKLTLLVGNTFVNALCFNRPTNQLPVLRGEQADFLCSLDLNTYLDRTTVQLGIKDIRPAADLRENLEKETELYHAIVGGNAPFPALPSRKEFEMVFRQFKGEYKEQPIDLFFFSRKLGMPFSRLLLTLDIFEEAGLLHRTRKEPLSHANVVLLPSKGVKASLESTATYRKMNPER